MEKETQNTLQGKKDYILEVENLKQYFPMKKDFFGRASAYVKAVDGVSFKLERGKTLGVVGESGCGKTTLGRTILRLYEITSGKAVYETEETAYEQKACKKVKVPLLNENGEEVFEEVFDKKGKPVLNQSGEVKLRQVFKKDEKGDYILKTEYKDNFRKPIPEYEVDENGEIVKEEITDKFGKTVTVNKIKRDANGKPIYKREIKKIDLAKADRKRVTKLRTKMQLIFQDPYSSLPPRMTVGAIIGEAVKVHKIVPKSKVYEYVISVMKRCGLQAHFYDRYPHEFSGGQRQRICIARALAVKPELVICDEPVSALDVSIQAQVINLLKKLQEEEGMSYIFISHDLSVVKYISDNIAVMYLGNIVETGTTEDICSNPSHPYTKALFSAVPVPDPHRQTERIELEGDLPSPANPPKGCKFHTRCHYCQEICKTEVPPTVEIEKGHFVTCHLFKPNEEKTR